MKKDQGRELKKHLDASGFPLQLAVQHQVLESGKRSEHSWTVATREHPWENVESGEAGFIDLVLKDGPLRMVIECKRPRDSSWIFLCPIAHGEPAQADAVRLKWVQSVPGQGVQHGWGDMRVVPTSPSSEFAIAPVVRQDGVSTLDAACRTLISSTDGLVNDELSTMEGSRDGIILYIPAIVTTASLMTCAFAPEFTPLRSGKVDDAEFSEVDWIRYRKSFATTRSSCEVPKGLKESKTDRDRTVLVIQAASLVNLLGELKIMDKTSPFQRYPWEPQERR